MSNQTLIQADRDGHDSEILNFVDLSRSMLQASRGEHTPVNSVGVRQKGRYNATNARTFSVAALSLSATRVSDRSAYQSAT